MPNSFDLVRPQLERQYVDVRFDPASGLAKEELVAELEQHRAANPGEPRILTKAWLLHLLCTKARLAPEPGDPFVGKLEHHGLLHALRREWWSAAGEREFAGDPSPVPGAYTAQLDCASHICPDWQQLLHLGASGLRARAAARPGVFYDAVALVFAGLVTLIRRFHALQPSPALAALAERSPTTLHEALQLAYLYHELLELDGMEVRAMGRFDRLYGEFFRADLRAGRLTRDAAKELLKYFWIKFFAKTQGKRFGKPFLFGPDADEFSALAFEAYREMRLGDPKLHVRMAARTPPGFLETVIRCIQDGCTSIVIVNDEGQVEMLRRHGKAPDDAADYILIGCYEPAVQGKELNCSGAAGLNLAKAVERVVAAGGYPTFGALLDAYLDALAADFAALADKVRRWERLWPEISPTPLLSGTMDSCLASGLDVSAAGALYNTSGCCCSGIADAVDSLAVIRQLVYEERRCTLAELRAALAANWEGHEELRLIAQHRVPKWGNNDSRADELAVRITTFLGQRINLEPNARGGVFQAALYGILPTVQQFGKLTGALPNGRRAGEPLAINTGAVLGMDRHGVTSLINSVTRIDLALFPNGTVLDVMLHPSVAAGAEGVQTIIALVRSHFAQGGMAIQFNIFDAATLREAQQHPERYANLQVRVCGWNVRFADLAPAEQAMFIAKAEAARGQR
jgi:formate C-acetyltransferase